MSILVFVLLAAQAPAAPSAPTPPAPAAADAAKARQIAEARAVYDKRAKRANHVRAVKAYAKLSKAYPDDRDLHVWCARTAYYAAHRFQDDSDTMGRIAKIGHRCAKRLIKRHPRDYEGRIWLAMTEFKWKVAEAFLPPLGKIKDIVAFLEGLRKQRPDQYAAYMLLGAMYRELPGWPVSVGDEDKALRLLQKADELSPLNAELLLELAAAYAKVGDEAKARATYNLCIRKGGGPPELTWETQDAQAYAKKMLAELD